MHLLTYVTPSFVSLGNIGNWLKKKGEKRFFVLEVRSGRRNGLQKGLHLVLTYVWDVVRFSAHESNRVFQFTLTHFSKLHGFLHFIYLQPTTFKPIYLHFHYYPIASFFFFNFYVYTISYISLPIFLNILTFLSLLSHPFIHF